MLSITSATEIDMRYRLQDYNFPFTYNYSKVSLRDFNKKNSMGGIYQNLLLENIPPVIIDVDSAIITEEISDKIDIYTFFDYYNQYIKHTFISSTDVPHLIIDMGGLFTNLQGINYSTALQEYLNKKGFEIYFWELPIFEFAEDRSKLKGLGTINVPDIVDDPVIKDRTIKEQFAQFKNNLVGFETDQVDLSQLFSQELEKINEFVLRNNLKNVTICSGFYNLSKFVQAQYPIFKFKTRDIFLASLGRSSNKNTISTVNYSFEIQNDQKFEYKFWSSNKRYEGYRHLLVAYIYDKSSLISFHPNLVSFEVLLNGKKIKGSDWEFYWKNINTRIWFDINDLSKLLPKIFFTNVELLNENRYLSIDKFPEDDNFENWLSLDDADEDIEIPLNLYKKCFCAVVTESTFALPFAHFADKILNAIKSYRPFILVAPPYTLEYINKLGFKTFNSWWDESYDREKNHQQRMLKIFNVIDYVNTKSIIELEEIYKEMYSILVHNYKNLNNLKLKNSVD